MDYTNVETIGAQNEGRWMTITHPHSGEPTDGQLLLAGSDSKIFHKSLFKFANDQARQARLRRGNKQVEMDAEESYQYSLKTLAECTLETRNVSWRGEKVEASDTKKLIAFYESFPKIRKQADTFIADELNYAQMEADVEGKSLSGVAGTST